MHNRVRSSGGTRGRAAALVLWVALGAMHFPWTALAAGMVEVAQKGRAFAVREVEVARGGMLRFTNEDDFPHQIHVKGPGMDVDSPLQNFGEAINVAFPTAGTFDVRCGVHPRMRMSVRVL